MIIYPEQFINKMIIKIQSFCRGFLVRKRLKEELNHASNKISDIKR